MKFLMRMSLMAVPSLVRASPTPTCFDANPIIRSPADLPILSTCTTLPVNLIIGASFAGSMTLPGVSLIGNSLLIDPEYRILYAVEEINMPDLKVVIEGLELGGLPKLHKLSMPSLKSLGSGAQPHNPSPMMTRIIQTGGPPMNLSFPELEEVGHTHFEGNFEAIDFPKLRRARNMYIKSTADLDCNAVLRQLEKVEFGREDTMECHSSMDINEDTFQSDGEQSGHALEDSSDGKGEGFVAEFVGWASQAVINVGRYIL